MIGYLQGQILQSQPDSLLLDVQGVGYQVHIPVSTFYEIQKLEGGATAALFVHTHVREDALQLYGFFTDRERQLFLRLISVSGIGPKLAQTILSGMAPDDLVSALAAGDLRRLNTIPGVGKKTAERMVLELKDKVRELAASPGQLSTTGPRTDDDEDLVQALVNLGYRPALAERALAKVKSEHPEDDDLAGRLRAALKLLSKT